jgi:hypothetical protein
MGSQFPNFLTTTSHLHEVYNEKMNFESNNNGEFSSFRIVEARSARDRYIRVFRARIFKQIYLQRFELGYLLGVISKRNVSILISFLEGCNTKRFPLSGMRLTYTECVKSLNLKETVEIRYIDLVKNIIFYPLWTSCPLVLYV